jgi:hypothetical protein
MEAQFINLTYLKKNTAISGNVDPAELLPHIQEAQDMHIQEILGSKLYKELVSAVYESIYGSPIVALTDKQKSLLDLLQPTLAYYTMYVALPFNMVKWKNKGLQKNSNPETGSSSAELREMQYLRENVMNSAKFYSDRVIKFLCNHSADYPSYNSQGTDPDIYPKTVNSFGFFLGSKGGLSDEYKRFLKKYIG